MIYLVSYEYIDELENPEAGKKVGVEIYTDFVREGYFQEFVEEGYKRSPDHFKIIKIEKYTGQEPTLLENYMSGFNITLKKRSVNSL